jgi:hypothetical protein
MRRDTLHLTALVALALPSSAFAATPGGVPDVLSAGAGVVGLLFAALLLGGMLSLKRIAAGAAIAENITYAVLAVLCLAASVLTGWLARWVPTALSAEQARLGADLLAIAAMALFGVYFYRVRLAMARYLRRLVGEEQLLVGVLDPDSEQGE